MSYTDRVNRALQHIELNLRGELSVASVAKAAAFSPYHFHRIFTLTVGEPINSYIRKRRLTEAALELQRKDTSILEIALRYHFGSQAAFSRAFKRIFGMSPGQYRKLQRHPTFAEQPRITKEALLHRTQGIRIETQIVTKPTFWVVGLEYVGSKDHDGQIPRLWEQFDQRVGEVGHRTGSDVSFGVCFSTPSMLQKDELQYLAGVPVDRLDQVPAGMRAREVKGGRYVLVTHRGPISKISETLSFVYGSWLPRSGFDPDDRADLELYDGRFKFDQDDSEFDLLVPIKAEQDD